MKKEGFLFVSHMRPEGDETPKGYWAFFVVSMTDTESHKPHVMEDQ